MGKKKTYLPLTEYWVCYSNEYKKESIEELTAIMENTKVQEIKSLCKTIIDTLEQGDENTFVLTDEFSMCVVLERNKSIIHWTDSDGELDDIFEGVVYSCHCDFLGCSRTDGGEDEVYIECVLV